MTRSRRLPWGCFICDGKNLSRSSYNIVRAWYTSSVWSVEPDDLDGWRKGVQSGCDIDV